MQRATGRWRVVRPRPGAVVVELPRTGDARALARLPQLFTTLLASHELVVVDLSENAFIEARILYALLKANRTARENGSRFRLQLGTGGLLQEELETTGLLGRFEHYRTREEALDPELPHAISGGAVATKTRDPAETHGPATGQATTSLTRRAAAG